MVGWYRGHPRTAGQGGGVYSELRTQIRGCVHTRDNDPISVNGYCISPLPVRFCVSISLVALYALCLEWW